MIDELVPTMPQLHGGQLVVQGHINHQDDEV